MILELIIFAMLMFIIGFAMGYNSFLKITIGIIATGFFVYYLFNGVYGASFWSYENIIASFIGALSYLSGRALGKRLKHELD